MPRRRPVGNIAASCAPWLPTGSDDGTASPASVSTIDNRDPPGWARWSSSVWWPPAWSLRFVQRSPLWLDEALSVNIARLPLGDLFEALRHDGHPPLYYVLLHGWMEVVGEGDFAVRALSGIFAVASLPLAWIAGRRLAGPAGARWALVVVALSPYCVRYATEARMYSLVMLLVLAGYLVLSDALDRAPAWRLAALALISGLLLLSHYWSFYLLAATGLVLAGALVVAAAATGQDRPGDPGGRRRRAAVPALAPRVPLPVGEHRHALGRAVPARRRSS